MSPFSWRRHPRHDLSAHADRQLGPERAAEIERHLTSCAECRTEFAEIVAVRTALSSLPEIPAPRSFALTPEQARSPARVYESPTGRTQLVTGLRLGSAGLAMALVVVVLLDGGGGSEPTNGDDAALQMESATNEYRISEGDGAASEDSEATISVPTPGTSPTADVTGESAGGGAGGAGTGGGSTSEGGSNSGGVGGVGATEPSPNTEAPAADGAAETAPAPTEAPPQATATPEEVLRATEDEFAQSGAGDEEARDGEGESASADAASDDDDDGNGLLALEILLALGAAGALIASVFVARAARRDPSGN